MNGADPVSTMFGFLTSLLIFTAGLLTYIFRNKPNMAIGFRIGYTFQSKDAWRRTNEFAGKAFMALGILMAIVNLFLKSPPAVTILMVLGISLILWKSYGISKEIVEREDLSKPAKGTPQLIKNIDIKPYILFQLALLCSYILLLTLSWDKMADTIATHFNFNGIPDRFEPKSTGAFLLPVMVSAFVIGLTYLGKDPMALRIPGGSVKVARISLELLTIIQLLLWGAFVYSLLYNAYGFSSAILLSLFTVGSIGAIVVETIRLLRILRMR
ncbi:SdpI family protein [Palaeococcus sp. (in: euryarchaeotes)]